MSTFERSRLCKASQTEGETVRYSLLKIYEKEKNNNKKIYLYTSCIITGLIILTFIYIYYFQKHSDNPLTLDDRDIYLVTIAIFIIWIDTIFIYTLFHSIEITNKNYKKDADNMIQVIKSINKEYPMYKSTKANPYPDNVEELYNLILTRWVNKNNELTLEDGKSSLIYLLDNNRFEEIYESLKFDITYRDRFLIKTIYDNYCNNHSTDDTVKCISNVDEILNHLQTYHPDSNYLIHKKLIQNYLYYSIFFTAFFVFPLFHFMYKNIGPGFVGFISISFIIMLSVIGYYVFMF